MKKPIADYPKLIPLWVAVYIDILGYSLLIPFMPFFMQAFHSSPLQIGMLLATNAVFGLFFGPLWGKLSDIEGRKPIMILCQIGTFAGFLMLAFSKSLPVLFLSRIIDGIFGGIFPISKAVIGDCVPPKDRSKQMANIGLGHILASLLGPGVGSLLARSGTGLLAPGLMAAGMTLLALILTVFIFPETNPDVIAGKKKEDLRKAANDNTYSVKKNRTALFLLVQWGFHTLSFSIFISTISLFAFLKLGVNEEEIGVLLTVAGLFRVFIRFVIFVPLIRFLGDRKTAIVGLLIFVLGYFFLSFVSNQILFIMVLMAVSFSASSSRSPLNSFLSQSVPPNQQGKINGYATSLENLGSIIGPILGGWVLGGFDTIWFGFMLAIISFIPFVMSLKKLTFISSKPSVPKPSLADDVD